MELDSVAAAPEIAGLVELDSVAATPAIAGLDTAAPPPAVDELSPEDCILPSLAQPPTMRLKKVIKIVSIGASLINWSSVSHHIMRGEGPLPSGVLPGRMVEGSPLVSCARPTFAQRPHQNDRMLTLVAVRVEARTLETNRATL
jgi:hypothetical protein